MVLATISAIAYQMHQLLFMFLLKSFKILNFAKIISYVLIRAPKHATNRKLAQKIRQNEYSFDSAEYSDLVMKRVLETLSG